MCAVTRLFFVMVSKSMFSVMIFPKQNTAISMLFCSSICQEFYQSNFASHLCNKIHLASTREKISVELPPPAHHLLPLTGDQQLVEERAVGEGVGDAIKAIVLECWLRCREEKLICKHRNES